MYQYNTDSESRPSIDDLVSDKVFDECHDDKCLIKLCESAGNYNYKLINVTKVWLEYGYDYKKSNLRDIIEKDDDSISIDGSEDNNEVSNCINKNESSDVK